MENKKKRHHPRINQVSTVTRHFKRLSHEFLLLSNKTLLLGGAQFEPKGHKHMWEVWDIRKMSAGNTAQHGTFLYSLRPVVSSFFLTSRVIISTSLLSFPAPRLTTHTWLGTRPSEQRHFLLTHSTIQRLPGQQWLRRELLFTFQSWSFTCLIMQEKKKIYY